MTTIKYSPLPARYEDPRHPDWDKVAPDDNAWDHYPEPEHGNTAEEEKVFQRRRVWRRKAISRRAIRDSLWTSVKAKQHVVELQGMPADARALALQTETPHDRVWMLAALEDNDAAATLAAMTVEDRVQTLLEMEEAAARNMLVHMTAEDRVSTLLYMAPETRNVFLLGLLEQPPAIRSPTSGSRACCCFGRSTGRSGCAPRSRAAPPANAPGAAGRDTPRPRGGGAGEP